MNAGNVAAVRMPALYIPHGGGPCFFMEWNPPDTWKSMEAYLRGIAATLPRQPDAILLISGHWHSAAFTLGAGARPELIYDYYGFPPHTYELRYPASGDPALAKRARQLLSGAGFAAQEDATRGYDHGMFIPLKLIYPEAQVPVVQLSLRADYDAAAHVAAGAALAPLRDEGVLIVGSGMSFHNLRDMRDPRFVREVGARSAQFDDWLVATVTGKRGAERADSLARWDAAPAARAAHPPGGEEHLLPLMVAAGAGGEGRGSVAFSGSVLGARVSGFRFD